MTDKILYWFKMMKDYYEDKYIKAILKLPDGYKLVVIYQKMMLKSLNTGGVLSYDGLAGSIEEELELELGEDLNSIRFLIEALDKFRLIERRNDGSIFMIALPVGAVGSESAVAQRVRKYREKKKQEEQINSLQCNSSVTQEKHSETYCNYNKDIEIEKEEEIDIELEKELDLEKELELELENDFEAKQDLKKLINNLIKLKLLTQEEVDSFPYERKLFQYSHTITYGLIQSMAIYVLERIPSKFASRYRQFEVAFENKMQEIIKLREK